MNQLQFDTNKWKIADYKPSNTLQMFITNKCNKKCTGCFYQNYINTDEMSLKDYDSIVQSTQNVEKIILIGGEPTLHKNIADFIKYNQDNGLRTTIYTNGFNLKSLEKVDFKDVTVRVGVLGLYDSEKPLAEIIPSDIPITMTYMLRKNNINEMIAAFEFAEGNFNCQGLFISSIRDIVATGDYWVDTPDTLPKEEYYKVVQSFINQYNGTSNKIHITKRSIFQHMFNSPNVETCRFLNYFPDKSCTICAFDIGLNIKNEPIPFNCRKCNKSEDGCLFQKITLERI